MSKNNIKNWINNNIDYNIMPKNVKMKVEYLEGLAKKVNNENKNKADKLIQLYKDRKIGNVKSAEKTHIKFYWIQQCKR